MLVSADSIDWLSGGGDVLRGSGNSRGPRASPGYSDCPVLWQSQLCVCLGHYYVSDSHFHHRHCACWRVRDSEQERVCPLSGRRGFNNPHQFVATPLRAAAI